MEPTPKQQEAITSRSSVAVTAGAGTGKTAMLAARFVHHVVNDGWSPIEIAAVTFTEKAAAELRSRIREQLTKAIGEERAAEVDAAQISTIHALAARICKDFYDLNGLAPDFEMLDETDAEILIANWFDEILATSDPMIIAELGYTWIRDTLRELLADPPAAETALWIDEDDYRNAIFQAQQKAITQLVRSDCWKTSYKGLDENLGKDGDKLKQHRDDVYNAMCDIANGKNIQAAVEKIRGAKINVGSAANWNGSIQDVKDCIRSMRDALNEKGEYADICLEYGDVEHQMYMKQCKLRHVFLYVSQELQLRKRERRLMDFSDLEHYALQALQNSATREHYVKRWKAILVDEFQDTNTVQEKLLELLSQGGTRLTIVGDGKQSIYGFRRADPRVFERFRRKINNDVVLDKTFRTHEGLVRPMNTVFEHILADMHQPLEAERKRYPHSAPFIESHSFVDDNFDIGHLRSVEGQYIAGEITRLVAQKVLIWDKSINDHRPVRPGDIAIISRTRAPLDIYIEHLLAAGIPAVNTGGGYLLETSVAKDLMMLIRFCSDTTDDIALVALLRGPFFGVDDITLYEMSRQRQDNESWWKLTERQAPSIEIIQRPFHVLSAILSASKREPVERLAEIADELTGYTAVISNLKQGERRMTDWFGFIALLRKFASLGRSDVFGADRYLKDMIAAESSIPRPPVEAGDAVSLMTIHAAKGLEWPVVFVPNLSADKQNDSNNICFDAEMGVGFKVTLKNEDGKYATYQPAMLNMIRAKKKRDEQEEANRILYVAMTRARDRLYVTSAGKESRDFATLIPGLEAAKIEIQRHDATFQPQHAPSIELKNEKRTDFIEQLSPVAPHFDAVAVTGLVDYSICPRRFKFKYVDGHPGVGEGVSANARLVGTLTHTALELDLFSPDALRPFADGANDELLQQAVDLALAFRDGESFRTFQLGEFKREVSIRHDLNGTILAGKADLVGDDYVLDFKTDSQMVPEHHAIQLWAYASALGKPRAVVAYLRQQDFHEYKPLELAAAESAAHDAVDGIQKGNFAAKPSEHACRRCRYSTLCSECFK